MGACTSCCRGQKDDGTQSTPLTLTRTISTGRTKDSLYEPALADSEREAVADLLAYLENVRLTIHPPRIAWIRHTDKLPARRDRLLLRRASSILEHSGLLGKCRLTTECELDIC